MTDGIIQEVFNNHYKGRNLFKAFDISDIESIKRELIEKIKQKSSTIDIYCEHKAVSLKDLIGDNQE